MPHFLTVEELRAPFDERAHWTGKDYAEALDAAALLHSFASHLSGHLHSEACIRFPDASPPPFGLFNIELLESYGGSSVTLAEALETMKANAAEIRKLEEQEQAELIAPAEREEEAPA